MKKLLSLLVAIVAISFVFTACSKSPDKVLDRKDGKWDASITTFITLPYNGVETTVVESGTYFFDDNKYTLMMNNGASGSGTWSATANQITFANEYEVAVVDVIKSGRKEQEWRRVYKATILGVEVNYDMIYKLKR